MYEGEDTTDRNHRQCFGIHKQKEGSLFLKRLLILCGVLCWIGFFAALYINENLWYIATVGYAVGPIVISTQVIRMRKRLGIPQNNVLEQ